MKFLYFLVILLLIHFSNQDLPVHCLKHDIVGVWIIKATESMNIKTGHDMNCGHKEPSEENSSSKAYSIFPLIKEYKLILKQNDEAEIFIEENKQTGKWTMVYDEGFNIEFKNISFFSFSKFEIERIGDRISYKSFCYKTCTGWFINGEKRGCYQAYKMDNDSNAVTNMKTILIRDINLPLKIFKFKQIIDFHRQNLEKLEKKPKMWNSYLYPEFENLNLKGLNNFAGFKRFKQIEKQLPPVKLSNSFPSNFNWMDKIKPAPNQGKICGSCYIISTLRMLEARLKILYNHDVDLSAQHVINCSFYNQGCGGGYPFLVMKFANEFELIPEKCQPYTEINGKCDNSCNISALPFLYKVIDYKYIGGSYGRCNEYEMMKELINNGPFVISFEPDYNFIFYKSGIYHSLINNPTKLEWEKVDHSVLLVGWGEDLLTKEKFWIVQNTWGPTWGENGFFRIRRGFNDFSIESTCESGTPVIIDNGTGIPIIQINK